MDKINNKDEEEKYQIQKCFFKISVERLTHLDPKSSRQIENAQKSISNKYLAVIEESTRLFLGIKRNKKYYGEYFNQFILSNEDVTNISKTFLQYYDKPKYIQMDINSEKNKFFSTYYAIKLIELFKILENEEYLWEEQGKNEILHKKFMDLINHNISNTIFQSFLKKEYYNKSIYASTTNSYDLGENPSIDIGIVDEFEIFSDSVRFFHIYEFSLGVFNRFQIESSIRTFHLKLVEYIKKTFLLRLVPLSAEYFHSIVFDVKDIHRKSKLLNEPILLENARRLNKEVHKYLTDKENLNYLDIHNFIVGFSYGKEESSKTLKAKKVVNVAVDNWKSQNQIDKILNIVLKENKSRIEYENQQLKEHKERLEVL